MKAELSFTFESIEELHDFTAKMAKPVPVVNVGIEIPPAAAAEEPRTTKIRKTKAAAPAPAPEPTLPATEETEPESELVVTIEEVRSAISAVNEKFGLVPARKVLNQFGVKRIPELKPKQYADFVKACSAVK